MGGPLALDDRHSMKEQNNQSKVGSSNELEVEVMASWAIWVVWTLSHCLSCQIEQWKNC
jgi:hypothetical protein